MHPISSNQSPSEVISFATLITVPTLSAKAGAVKDEKTTKDKTNDIERRNNTRHHLKENNMSYESTTALIIIISNLIGIIVFLAILIGIPYFVFRLIKSLMKYHHDLKQEDSESRENNHIKG